MTVGFAMKRPTGGCMAAPRCCPCHLNCASGHCATGEGPGAAGEAQEASPFDQLPVVLQLDVISRAKELRAVGVSRGWLGLTLQSGVVLKLGLSQQRSPAARSFWRAQLSAPGVRLRLLLPGAAGAPAPDVGWLFHEASYPGITHLVSWA